MNHPIFVGCFYSLNCCKDVRCVTVALSKQTSLCFLCSKTKNKK